MSMGPLASVAGSPLAQTKGSELDRTQHDANVQQRRAASAQRSESAAGIGETDGQDHETAERDADGRRPWEIPANPKASDAADDPSADQSRQSKDATGQTGSQLDLCG
jgi:hypothetical protein